MNKTDRGRGEAVHPASGLPETCQKLIADLKLQAHPEGGWYREWYRSPLTMTADILPEGFSEDRSLVTAIYYLLPGGSVSAWHRIRSDELWLFQAGAGLEIHQIDTAGNYKLNLLGPDNQTGETLNHTVTAGTWFAARPRLISSYSLVNCIVAPGFDFRDFELAEPNELLSLFPQQADLIRQFSKTGRF